MKVLALTLLVPLVSAHYTFPSLKISGSVTPEWEYVRMTNNHWTRNPVTDVSSADFRCYDTETDATAETISVAAGSTISIMSDDHISHPSVSSIYMAKAPGDASSFDGSGNVWFKVYELPAIANGNTISFPSEGREGIEFTIPKNLPSGQYLIRTENIALHGASSFGGAQFYISCAQVEVTNGGNGTPGPLVAFPGAYTGREPGIMINIYWPIPTSYTMPGPAVWSG